LNKIRDIEDQDGKISRQRIYFLLLSIFLLYTLRFFLLFFWKRWLVCWRTATAFDSKWVYLFFPAALRLPSLLLSTLFTLTFLLYFIQLLLWWIVEIHLFSSLIFIWTIYLTERVVLSFNILLELFFDSVDSLILECDLVQCSDLSCSVFDLPEIKFIVIFVVNKRFQALID
jgi:hypothetical protein